MLVLLSLAVAVEGPVLIAGWRNAELAGQEAAQGQYAQACRSYELAARQLPWRTELWEQAGLASFRGGQAADAIRLLQIAEKHLTLSVDGSVALGSALWTSGDASSAIAAWQAGLKVHPGEPALLDRLVAAFDQKRAYAEERTALIDRLAAGPDALANYRLGILLMVSDPNRAGAQLQEAATLDSQYGPAVMTLRAALQAAAQERDPAARSVWIGRGLGLVQEWGPALEAFDEAVLADQQNAEAWAWLGEAQQHIGQDGRQALDNALRLDPRDAVVHSLRALYFARRGEQAAALAEQLQAAQLQPQDAGMQVALGEAYAAAGNLVAALATYQQATSLAPQDPATWMQLAAFCANNGVQVETVGLPAALKAVSLAPRDAQALDVLGWSLAQAGSLEAAKEKLVQAIQSRADLAPAHLHLAEVYLRLGEYGSALGELEKTTELDPNGAAGHLAGELLQQYFP